VTRSSIRPIEAKNASNAFANAGNRGSGREINVGGGCVEEVEQRSRRDREDQTKENRVVVLRNPKEMRTDGR